MSPIRCDEMGSAQAPSRDFCPLPTPRLTGLQPTRICLRPVRVGRWRGEGVVKRHGNPRCGRVTRTGAAATRDEKGSGRRNAPLFFAESRAPSLGKHHQRLIPGQRKEAGHVVRVLLRICCTCLVFCLALSWSRAAELMGLTRAELTVADGRRGSRPRLSARGFAFGSAAGRWGSFCSAC